MVVPGKVSSYMLLGVLVLKLRFRLPAMVAILDFWVIMMSLRQTDDRIGILVVDVPEKVSSYMLLGVLV